MKALATPKAIFTDQDTGHEVWRMTNDPEMDIMLYYDFPTISPNGKYLIFRSNRSNTNIIIMNTDGSGEKPIGDWYVWNRDRGIDFSTGNLHGWWSHDSRYYYVFGKLYVIDIDKFQSGAVPANYISQVSATYANNFFYPMLSPDGRKLYGVSISGDSSSGGTLKFINIDGTNYKEFTPPYYVVPGSIALDVTHGWLGNDQAWYMNDDMTNFINSELVFNIADGSKASDNPILEVRDPNVADEWWGIMDHTFVSPSAYFIGHGDGFVGGNGRSLKFANTKYWSQDSIIRELTTISIPTVSNHMMFSPDAKWVSTAADSGADSGFIVAYPIRPVGSRIKIARATYSDPKTGWVTSDPGFSPDGTKNIYWGDVLEAGNYDIYMAIFKKPDPPTGLFTAQNGSNIQLTFKPAPMHREIKEYEIYRSLTENGTYGKIGTLTETYTYLSAPSKIGTGDTTINVDDTTNFPASGVIEISGLSTERTNELVSYTGKTSTSFTGCTRGYGGTNPAEHYNDSFVWRYTGNSGYTDTLTPGAWYKVKSVEWSGLTSDFSSSVSVNPITTIIPTSSLSLTPTPGCLLAKQGDINCSGKVNALDLSILLGAFGTSDPASDLNSSGKVNALDMSILLNNFGKFNN